MGDGRGQSYLGAREGGEKSVGREGVVSKNLVILYFFRDLKSQCGPKSQQDPHPNEKKKVD